MPLSPEAKQMVYTLGLFIGAPCALAVALWFLGEWLLWG